MTPREKGIISFRRLMYAKQMPENRAWPTHMYSVRARLQCWHSFSVHPMTEVLVHRTNCGKALFPSFFFSAEEVAIERVLLSLNNTFLRSIQEMEAALRCALAPIVVNVLPTQREGFHQPETSGCANIVL